MTLFRRVCLILMLAGAPAYAVDLGLPPSARQLADRISPLDSYALPTGAWQDGVVPAQIFEGRVQRQTWRIDSGSITTLQVLAPLRDQITEAGFDVVFDCEDSICGGFDFRFGIEVVPAPDMHVDIRDYRFLSAVRDNAEALSVLVSRSRSAAYIQIIQVAPVGQDPLAIDTGTGPSPLPLASSDDLIARLTAEGHAILPDLEFQTGADALANGPYASLAALAAFLQQSPDLMIAIVGHTDSVGNLDRNIELSKRRAESVRARMVAELGTAPDQVRAEGMGYLAPVASNLTSEGREANRRVEVVLLPKP